MYLNYEKLRKIYSSETHRTVYHKSAPLSLITKRSAGGEVDNSGYLLLFEKIKLLKKDIGNF